MIKQLKNYLLYDASPEHSEFLQKPGTFLKKLLLDDPRRPPYSRSFSGFSSSYPTPRPSVSPSLSGSFDLSDDLITDDGHPGGLGNPKILSQILGHLPSSQLLQCRLVSLRWNVVSSSLLQRKLGYSRIPPSKLKSFIKTMEVSVSNPVASYAIRINSLREKHTLRFLHLFCLQIVHLRVRLNITELVEFSRHLQNMRNLKHLHVIVFEDGVHSHNHFIWNSSYEDVNVSDENGAWKMGLYSFPKVTRLILENAEPAYQITPFYDRVVANIISACGNLKDLSLLSWNSPLGRIFEKWEIGRKPGILDVVGKKATVEEIVNLFFHTNLRFHELRLEVNSQVRFEVVADVIHRCGESLQELGVQNDNIFERFQLSSALRSLVKLRLSLWRGPVNFRYFSRQFPALRMVSLNLSNLFEVEQVGRSEVGKIFEPCETVRTLTMTRLETGVDVKLVEKLAVMFPNLRELFVEVRNGKAVEGIYQVFGELTLLCVELNINNFNEVEDDDKTMEEVMTNGCFTGVPEEEIRILEERECGCPVVDFADEARSCWNIGCLKNLTTLLLRVPNTVNNITLLEGISRLEYLQNLVLLPFYDEEADPVKWCLRSIADNFPKLRTLVTSTEVDYSDDDLGYLMERLPNLVHRRKP